jgi:hypothetical protein
MAAITGQYRLTPITYSSGDFVEVLPTDANGNLMVNIAAGEEINVGTLTLGTINMIKAGTISAGTINSGTINAGTINTGTINSGTINAGTVAMPILYQLATVNIGSGVASGTTANTLNGMLYKITQAVGTLSGTPGTITTNLVDTLGGTIASLAAQAESSTTTYSTTVPLNSNMSWIVTATGDPDGTQTAAAGVDVVFGIHYQK